LTILRISKVADISLSCEISNCLLQLVLPKLKLSSLGGLVGGNYHLASLVRDVAHIHLWLIKKEKGNRRELQDGIYLVDTPGRWQEAAFDEPR